MNNSLPLITLLAALAAGSASAAGTVAGSSISNIATATFTDENGAAQPTVQSNNGVPVTTRVQAVPSFIIKPDSTGTPGVAGFTPGAGNDLTGVRPGDTNVAFKYVLTNTGNVQNESYTLSRLTYNSGSGISNVRYYLDNGNGSFDAGDTLISGDKIVSVNPDETRTFYIVFDTSSASTNGQQIAISPVGTRDANTVPDNGLTFSLSDSDNYGRATISRVDAGNLGPYNDPNADGTNAETGQPVPASYTVTDQGTTTTVTYGAAGSRDTQTATAPAKTTGQTVTFINSVRNTGNRADTFTLSVPDAATLDALGFPAGTTAALYQLDGSGNPTNTPVTTTPSLAADPDGTGTGLGGKYSFAVRVTLPAGATPDATGTIPYVTVKSTSANDPTNSDTTTDLVRIESGLFGNATPGTPGTPAADPTLNPTKPGTPNQAVTIPMDLYNTGNVQSSYTVAGTVTFTDANGQPIVVPITYYADANGDGVADNGTAIINPSVTPGQEVKLVGLVTVPAGAVTGTATVSQTAVLKDAGGNPVITYTDANDTVQVGLVGGVIVKKFVDNGGASDTGYTTTPSYADVPASYNQGSQAKPADVLRYTVFARNERNAVIKGFVLSDAIPTNTGLYSVVATYNANGSTYTTGKSAGSKVMYKVGTAAWTTVAPTDTTLAAGTVLSAAYDWNNDGDITSADVLPAGAELQLVFKVKLK